MNQLPPTVVHLDELALVRKVRDTQRPVGNVHSFIQRELNAGMELGVPLNCIDDRLIVFLDANALVGALGFPHGNEFVVFERHLGNRMRCVTVPGPIVSAGSWNLCRIIVAVNSARSWGFPGPDGEPTSVASLLDEMRCFEQRVQTE